MCKIKFNTISYELSKCQFRCDLLINFNSVLFVLIVYKLSIKKGDQGGLKTHEINSDKNKLGYIFELGYENFRGIYFTAHLIN